jgi:endonuclease/exonuclease/phosphatase family metal-dependent hydrolase
MIRLAVASYNVRSCRGLDGRQDPERIARIIRRLNADVVGLQEVAAVSFTGGLSQLKRLAELTASHEVAGPALLSKHSPGTALLTRYRPLAVERLDLSIAGREPRGALAVDLDIAGLGARVVVTHFGLKAFERRRQVESLLEFLDRHHKDLLILLGAINEWRPSSRVLRQLDERLGQTLALRTFPAPAPVFALDRLWVYCRGGTVEAKLRVDKAWPARIASDHLPLIAEIAIRTSAQT